MKQILVLLSIAICFTTFLSSAWAVPGFLMHQGKIINSDQSTQGGVDQVTFRLYESATGGSSVWSQTLDVTMDDGHYSVVLGPGTPDLESVIEDDSTLYLGITLEGVEEFLPRYQLVSVPYALHAGSVFGPVHATEGLIVNDEQVIDSEGNLVVSGTISVNGREVVDSEGNLSHSGTLSIDGGLSTTGNLEAGEVLVIDGVTLDADTLNILKALLETEIFKPADGATVDRDSIFEWRGLAAPFMVELDVDTDFSDPFTADIARNWIAADEFKKDGQIPENGSYYWRVRTTGFELDEATEALSVEILFSEISGGPMEGTEQANAGTTCNTILTNNSGAESGVYWIDPNEGDHNDAFQVYCNMETDGGGWTLAYVYSWTDYNNYNSGANAVTPRPDYPMASAQVPVSTTPPLNETDGGAISFALWSDIGEEFMITSDINHWLVCEPGDGSLVTFTDGSLSCRNILDVPSSCAGNVPNAFAVYSTGPGLNGSSHYYFWDHNTSGNWPTHDPCGNNQTNHKPGVTDPRGAIWLR